MFAVFSQPRNCPRLESWWSHSWNAVLNWSGVLRKEEKERAKEEGGN